MFPQELTQEEQAAWDAWLSERQADREAKSPRPAFEELLGIIRTEVNKMFKAYGASRY